MEYEAVIGLEVHAQIHTRSKMFCACPVVEDTGDLPPNTYVCPVCTAMPGTLPVINRRAVELTLMTAVGPQLRGPAYLLLRPQVLLLPRPAQAATRFPSTGFPLGVNGYLDIQTEAGPGGSGSTTSTWKRIRANSTTWATSRWWISTARSR